MLEYIWEIGASGWFYYKEICYDARLHECKILPRFILDGYQKQRGCQVQLQTHTTYCKVNNACAVSPVVYTSPRLQHSKPLSLSYNITAAYRRHDSDPWYKLVQASPNTRSVEKFPHTGGRSFYPVFSWDSIVRLLRTIITYTNQNDTLYETKMLNL